MSENIIKDAQGRRLDCHFCTRRSKGLSCTVLKDFYNAGNDNKDELCGECPFFKTEDDFWKGWNKRGQKYA